MAQKEKEPAGGASRRPGITLQLRGKLGEKIALNFLQKKGYQILDRNFVCPSKGEIDIVAKKDDIISFVEVKLLRNPATLILPEAKVDFQKQKKLVKTAQIWLMENKIPLDSKWQIDVIAIELNLVNKKAKIRHFKNAVSDT